MKNKIIYAFVLLIVMSVSLFGCSDKEVAVNDEQQHGISMPKPGSEAKKHTDNTVNVESDIISDTPVQVQSEIKEPVYERVSFMGCGDNIIYYGNVRDAKSLSDGTRKYNFKPMFAQVSDKITDADIAFINQETVMAGEGYDLSYYPRFNSPRDVGYDLVELGYDVINIANNHMLDKGAQGLSNTIEFWKGQDCLMIGGYEDAADYDTVRTLEKNGINIAFLSYTYATNGISKGKNSPLAIPYINDDDIKRQTEKAKEKSDFIIVSVHWGDEGSFKPNNEQKRVAQLLADCGVDVIIGHHPHVIQPVEWLYGRDGNRTLCVYSLGNFAAEQAYAYNMVGGIISFDIVSEDNGKPYVENPIFTPTVFHFNSRFYQNTVYPMQEYTEELVNAHGVKTYYKKNISLAQLRKYVTDTVSPVFLPEGFVS